MSKNEGEQQREPLEEVVARVYERLKSPATFPDLLEEGVFRSESQMWTVKARMMRLGVLVEYGSKKSSVGRPQVIYKAMDLRGK